MEGLSQAKAKQIRLLGQKKHRQEQGLFLIEGTKMIRETLASDWPLEYLVLPSQSKPGADIPLPAGLPVFAASPDTLSGLGNFQTNSAGILVARQKPIGTKPDENAPFWLVLDRISDPGNLGTIIRLADWFGLSQVLLLGDCVEWWNPKVVAASMGSLLRIRPVRVSREQVDTPDRPWFAADMEGQNLYDFRFPDKASLLIGNEAHGLDPDWLRRADRRIRIPAFGQAESLNAAMATGLLLNHWRQFQPAKP